jgi:spore maturation protein CgeB
LIESLKGLPVAIFGDPAWKEAGAFAASCYRGGPVTTERANLIYASGAIALNFHHPQFRRGTSLRTFALCAAGAFQLADWREGLDRWLTPGVDLETFRTPDELRSLAERYLADAPGRRRIADAGQRRVLTEHTYAHRLATMLHREVAPCA